MVEKYISWQLNLNYRKKMCLFLSILINLTSIFFATLSIHNNQLNDSPHLTFRSNSLDNSYTYSFQEKFETIDSCNIQESNITGWDNGEICIPRQDIPIVSHYVQNVDKIKAVQSSGNLLFASDNSKGVKILNLSNIQNTILISRIGDPMRNTSLDLTIQGRYAYNADGFDGLEVFDISKPRTPVKINSWTINENCSKIWINDNLAYLSFEDHGIEILDISNPYQLNNIGTWTISGKPGRVSIHGNHMYVVTKDEGLEIIDISNPANPNKIGNLPLSDIPYQVQEKNNILYIAEGEGGFKIIDASDPTNPVLKSSFYHGGIIKEIIVEENYAYLACGAHGVEILDISNSENPKLLYHWEGGCQVTSLHQYGQHLILGCESKGIKIVKISEILTLNEISEYSPNLNAQEVVLDGKLLYACSTKDGSFDEGLHVLDVSNPTNPQYLDSFEDSGFQFHDAEIVGDTCFTATYEKGLISFNLTNSNSLEMLDSVGDLLNYSSNLDIHGNVAFVADGFDGLNMYNVSDPSDLKFIKKSNNGGTYYDVKIRNDCAFIAKGYKGIEILNISDLSSLDVITTHGGPYNNSQALDFWGNFLLVADRFDGLEILDISDLKNPKRIGQHFNFYNRTVDVEVLGNLAFISDTEDGIEMINISNPYSPVMVKSYSDEYNNSKGLTASDRFIYTADGHDGLEIVKYKEHYFNQFKNSAVAQSKTVDNCAGVIENATMTIQGSIPTSTQLKLYLSNDNGIHWQQVINDTKRQFNLNASELIWKIEFFSNDELSTPEVNEVRIIYEALNTPPEILNLSELQELANWSQLEDFGSFRVDLSRYKTDGEDNDEVLTWTIQGLDTSLVIYDQVGNVFTFKSVNNSHGSDQFDLILKDSKGAVNTTKITINVISVNDIPYFNLSKTGIVESKENNSLEIQFSANDVDHDKAELVYDLYYGSDETNWTLIVDDCQQEYYNWNPRDVPSGKYHVKIVVSDGINENTWISPLKYTIQQLHLPDLTLVLIILIPSVGGIIGLLAYLRYKRETQAIDLEDFLDNTSDRDG